MNIIIPKPFFLLSIFVIICIVFIPSITSFPSQRAEESGGKEKQGTEKQEWSEKDLIRLRKGFERIRWTFHEFIRRLYEPKKVNPSRINDHHAEVTSGEAVSILKELSAQIRELDETFRRRLEESPLDEKGLAELNQLVFELSNMFAELSDELKRIPQSGNRRRRETNESGSSDELKRIPQSGNRRRRETDESGSGGNGTPDYGNTLLGIFTETTQQMRNINDRLSQISAQMSRIMQTGARIVTGQMRSVNGTSDSLNPWSYGEPAFRGITASMEMLSKLQNELSTLNGQWRDLAWKMIPTSITGSQDSASSDRKKSK